MFKRHEVLLRNHDYTQGFTNVERDVHQNQTLMYPEFIKHQLFSNKEQLLWPITNITWSFEVV